MMSMARRTRKAHSKTFSGCWTCKAKHIKCDETKPECNRCQRSGWTCEGYGVRLSWTRHRGPSHFRRPSDSSDRNSQGDFALSSTEQPASTTERFETLDAPDTISEQPNDELFVSLQQQEVVLESSHQRPGTTNEDSGQPLIETQDTTIPLCGSPHAASPTIADDPTEASFSALLPSTTLNRGHARIQWLPPYKSPSEQSAQLADRDISVPDAPQPSYSLSSPSLDCHLLDHWNLELCDALNPLPGIHNPLRTVVTPLAHDGAAQKSSSTATAATALFHLICSASAFHLSKRCQESDEDALLFEKSGLQHHNLGIRCLSYNIHSKDKRQFTTVLASLYMCLLNEAITVPTPFWRLHIRGAVEWLNQIDHESWRQSENASIMYQMFIAMAILMQSQLLPDERNWPVWDIHTYTRLQLEPYTLEEVLGLPKRLMQAIYSMNTYQMRRQQQHQPNEESSSPQNHIEMDTQELDAMELEILLSLPTRPPLTVGKEYVEMIYHHGYTYYYAALVYMRRTLKDIPLEKVQPLVEQSLTHLEALTRLCDRPFCPVVWPIAFLAFEAGSEIHQQRMRTYLTFFARQSQLAIWEEVTRLVTRIWSRREEPGYQDMKWYLCLPFCSAECMLI